MSNPNDADLEHYNQALDQAKSLTTQLDEPIGLVKRGSIIQQLEGCYDLMDSILRANDLSHIIPQRP